MKRMVCNRWVVSGFRDIGDRQYKVLTCEYACSDCRKKELKEFATHPWNVGDVLESLTLNHAPWCMCRDDSKRLRFPIGSAYQRKHRLTKRQVNP
jgi:hypothetical protein